jgi:hypothetical protein
MVGLRPLRQFEGEQMTRTRGKPMGEALQFWTVAGNQGKPETETKGHETKGHETKGQTTGFYKFQRKFRGKHT